MTTFDPLSPRAAKALRDAGFESLAAAALDSDESLLALPGFGETSLRALREVAGGADDDDEAEEDDAHAELLLTAEAFFAEQERGERASDMLHSLAEKATTLTPALIQRAWELADVFAQEAEVRAAGGTLPVVADGLTVLFEGRPHTVRTSFRAGEAVPEGTKKLALVPAETA